MPSLGTSESIATNSSTSTSFTGAMQPGQTYRLASTVLCWFKITVTGGSAAKNTADNHLLGGGLDIIISNPDTAGTTNAFVRVINDAAAGNATLSLVTKV